MAKKNKRNVAVAAAPVKSAVDSRTAAPITGTSLRTPAAEFNPDYTYVVNDLKRIGLLAGGAIAILVILSFII